MQINGQDEYAERQHPETDNWQKADRAAENEKDTNDNSQDWRTWNPHSLVAEAYRSHEMTFSAKIGGSIRRTCFGR